MKWIKEYIIELLFWSSFVLPWLHGTITINDVTSPIYWSGIQLMGMFYPLAIALVLFAFLTIRYQTKRFGKWCFVSYILFLIWSVTLGDLLASPPTSYWWYFTTRVPQLTYYGLVVNIFLAICLIRKWRPLLK